MNSEFVFKKPNIYQIRIKGHIESRWSQWFDDFTITREEDGITTLTGEAEDDGALYGLLKKIRDYGMPLLSVNIVDEMKEE